ncbi:MAG TPA: hypothetical protein VG738_08045 [Chitinophagaceae bacterium]|nr:hypothetical protein [Chitinophagaceae bacterium]
MSWLFLLFNVLTLINFTEKNDMVTAVQDKNKTTITISRRLTKKELERVINYIDLPVITPRKSVTRKDLKKLADEIGDTMWKKFAKQRGLK